MPTIFPTTQPAQTPISTPSTPQPNLVGPRVVLPNMTSSAPEPVAAPVITPESAAVEMPTATPEPEPVTTGVEPSETENIHELLSELQATEQKVLDELQELRNQQNGIMSQVKSLVEKTGLVESKESALEKQLATLQTQREQLQQVTVPTATNPAPTPVMPTSVMEPRPAPEPTVEPLNTDAILAKLRAAFVDSSPELATLLQPGAQVYITGEHALLVEHAEHTVLFSNEDVEAAGLSEGQLTMLPQKSTQHLPPAADVEARVEVVPADPIAPITTTAETVEQPAAESAVHTGLLDKLMSNGTAEIIALVKQHPTIFRASTGNGIAIIVGETRLVVPDAELLRYGVTGPDVIGLPPEGAQPVPHVSEV